eukprot:scaffold1954_cov268-Pinguiococcus_pyrenoidosus.AAC.208
MRQHALQSAAALCDSTDSPVSPPRPPGLRAEFRAGAAQPDPAGTPGAVRPKRSPMPSPSAPAGPQVHRVPDDAELAGEARWPARHRGEDPFPKGLRGPGEALRLRRRPASDLPGALLRRSERVCLEREERRAESPGRGDVPRGNDALSAAFPGHRQAARL